VSAIHRTKYHLLAVKSPI